MTALERVEAWAKARGYWTETGFNRHRSGPVIRPVRHPDHAPRFQVADASNFDHWWDLAPPVAWLWCLAVDTGRTVRRRCPGCKGAKVVHWDGEDARPPGFIPCPTCTGPAVECDGCDGWGSQHAVTNTSNGETRWLPGPESMAAHRDCPVCKASCTIPGKPTGYLDVPLGRVVCEAAPRECETVIGWNGDRAAVVRGSLDAKIELIAHKHGWLSYRITRVTDEPEDGISTICAFIEYVLPGDPTARTELLAAAYGLDPGLTDEERARLLACETI